MEDQARQRGNALGDTAREVATNLKRVRQEAGLTQGELSQRVGELGWKIPPAAIGKIETNDRRVEVDDLMVLSVALDVSPLALLMPWTTRPGIVGRVSGQRGITPADGLWRWAVGDQPFDFVSSKEEDVVADVQAFRYRSLPPWLQVLAEVPSYPGER
jgi:transcriptional regulator with XRE-family HTH domain